jgi:DNA-binding transcriptional MocR family regulator
MEKAALAEGGSATLTEGVVATIRGRIAARALAPGDKLPSIRALAKALRVSKSTVVEAYERLTAEGAIRPKRASGFFVCGRLAPLSLSSVGARLDREIDPLWVSRQSLEAGEDALKPGCGWLPPSWMPEESLRRSLRQLARAEDAVLTDYSSPLGLLPLRQLLARRLHGHGIDVPADRILLTESGTQAIDLLCRFFIEPGDTILVDDPCYFNFHALLRAHRVKVVGVPYTPSGPDIALFAEALEEHRPRLYITNSAIHNPTGATLSPVVAHRVLKLAEQSNLIIIEDDIFADLEAGPVARLATFDGLDRVVQIGSFSKTLSASARCGFIATKSDWIDGLTDLKIATSFGGSQLSEALVLGVLNDGAYRRHLESLRARLSHAMQTVIHRLKAIGIEPWIEPQAGIFLWCRLPEGIDAAELSRRSLEHNIVLAPGNVFSSSLSASGFLRFNIAQSLDERIFDTLGRLMKDCRRSRYD